MGYNPHIPGDFLDFLTFTVSAIDFFLFGFLLDLDLLRFSGCFLLVEITSHLGTLVATAYASDTLLFYPRKNLQECSFKTPFSHRPGKTVPTGLTERTPKPEYVLALASDLGVRWDSVPLNF